MARTHTSERGRALRTLRSSSWLLLALLLLAPLRGLAQDATPAPATPAPATPAPTTPAPTTPTVPLLWTVVPTRAQLQAEIDAFAAELAAAEKLPAIVAALKAKSGRLYLSIATARRGLNRTRNALRPLNAPASQKAHGVRIWLIEGRQYLEHALVRAAATRDDLLGRIVAVQAGIDEVNRQLQAVKGVARRFPLAAGRTLITAEREFEAIAQQIDLYGLSNQKRRADAAAHRVERMAFAIHDTVAWVEEQIRQARTAVAAARAVLPAESGPVSAAMVSKIVNSLHRAISLSWGAVWQNFPHFNSPSFYLLNSLVFVRAIDGQKEIERMARAKIGKTADPSDVTFPRRRALAENLAAAFTEIERLERERASLSASTQDSEVQALLNRAAKVLFQARSRRWASRSGLFLLPPSYSMRGFWLREGELLPRIQVAPNYYIRELYSVHLIIQQARFLLRQPAVFSVAGLQLVIDVFAERIDGLAGLVAEGQGELEMGGREAALARARGYLDAVRRRLALARGNMVQVRAALARARSIATSSTEFDLAAGEIFGTLNLMNHHIFWAVDQDLIRRFIPFSLEARGLFFERSAPMASNVAWIVAATHAEHSKEIEVVAREVRDARVYATTRANYEGQVVPTAAASRFTAAEQHVGAARRELAGVRGVAAAEALPRAAVDAIQGELEAARADVAEGLAVLDREVAPNVFALRGRLRDATAALDAAEAQIGRAETHLAANLPRPPRASYGLSLIRMEDAWRQVDLHGPSPRRLVERYNREEEVEIHRAHNRVARARREYLAAARAHLAKVSKALTPAPAALTPTLLATVTGDLLGAEADRQALREEIFGARRGEDLIRQHIRPKRAMALRRQPTIEPPRKPVSPSRQLWADRLVALGEGLLDAESDLQSSLVARPPALQTPGDVRAARIRAGERSVARAREQLFLRTRHVLQGLGAVVPRWPRTVAEGFVAAHSAVRTAQNQLERALGVSPGALRVWRDNSAADVATAEKELAALRTALGDKTLPVVDALIAEASPKITARSTRQKAARDELNRANAADTKLSDADLTRLLDEFAFASTLEVVLQPLIRGNRIVAAAMQPAPVGTPPAAPTGVTANGMAPYVMVGWSVRTGERYSVYRCVTAAPASCGGARATGLTTSPYLDLTAPPGQSYSYRVRAQVGRRQSALSAAAVGARPAPATAVATVLLKAAGDGTNGASAVGDVAVDGRGVVYAVARDTDNVFRIGVDGAITRILSAAGDGTNALDGPEAVAVSREGVVYVAGGASDNVFRVAADGTVTRVLAAAGDGTNTLDFPADVAVEASGAVVVAGRDSDNVFRVAADGTITQIASSTGDGTNALDEPVAVAVAPDGGVYVAGRASNNVFRVAADGAITQVASATGDGTDALRAPTALAVDAAGNALVVGSGSGTVFRVTPKGAVTRIYKATAETQPRLQTLRGVAVDGAGKIYVTAHGSDDIALLASDGTARQILGGAGVGTTRLDGPTNLVADAAGNLYVASSLNHAVFRISTRVHGVLASTDAGSFALREPAALALAGDGRLYVADRQGSGRMFTVTRGGVLETSFPLAAAAPSWVSAPRPTGLALDAAQQFYVTGQSSDNAVAGALWNTGALRELVAAAGDGSNRLRGPTALVVGAAGTVYVAGGTSDNVFRVTAAGAVTQLLGRAGDGTNALDAPSALALHSDGTLYVAGRDSDNVFRVTAAGVVSQLLGPAGVGDHALDGPVALALNTAGDLFIASAENDNVFRVPVKGAATRVASAAGDGVNALDRPVSLAVDAGGELYVAGDDSHNVLRVSPGGAVVQLIGASGDGRTRFHGPVAVVARTRGVVAVATAGRTGSAAIPAAVFRVEAQPAVVPSTPAPRSSLPLLWTVAPTRAQLQGEIDAVAAELTAAEATSRFQAALEAESGSLHTKIAAARTQLATARTRFAAITGAPTVAFAAGVRQGLIESGAARARAQNEAADTTEEALTARVAAAKARLLELHRQTEAVRKDAESRFPLDADRTLGDAEREFEPTARELDRYGLSSARRRAAGARHRAERLTFAIHRAVAGSQAALDAAGSALAAARAAVAAAPTPIPAATVNEIVAALDRAALGSRATAVVPAGLLDDPGSLFQALMAGAEVDRQKQLAAATGSGADPRGAVPPRRSAIAEDVAVAFSEQERLAGELAALPATTTDAGVQRIVRYAGDRLAHAREQRWRRRSEFSFATSTWSGLWEPGEVAPLQAIAGASYGESLLRAGAWIREAGFALRQSAVFTAAALADEVERVSGLAVDAAGLLAAARSEVTALVVPAERVADRTAARTALTAAEADLAAARSQLVVARAELAKAQGATAGSAEFVRAGRALLSATGAATASVGSALRSDFGDYQRSLYAARGKPADPAAPTAFTAAWIVATTRAEHGKEIEGVAREVRDARVYATTRALLEGRAPPAAVAVRFSAADQHVGAARRELAGVRGVAAATALPRAAADAIQRELEEARADVAVALAALDRQVAPNVFALRGRLRDVTAAVAAAEAQIGRGETHLTTSLPLPTGVNFAASLLGLETAWRQVDKYGRSPLRDRERYNREQQVDTHRAHNRVARSRREYLAAARAHLAKVRAALTPAPAVLTPALLTTVTGDLLGAEADRRAVREEIVGARRGEDTIRRRIRPPSGREPAKKQEVSRERRVLVGWLASLGGTVYKAEQALEEQLTVRPPALQAAGDAQAASLRLAEGSLALAREQLFVRTRHILQTLEGDAATARWPLVVGEGLRATLREVLTMEIHRGRAAGPVLLNGLRGQLKAIQVHIRLINAEAGELSRRQEGRAGTGRARLPEVDTLLAEADAAFLRLFQLTEAVEEKLEPGDDLTQADRDRLFGALLLGDPIDAYLAPIIRGHRAYLVGIISRRNLPPVPTGVAASVGTSSAHVAVSWSVRAGEAYSVFRCVTADLASCGEERVRPFTPSPYLDVTVPAGQSFHYRVQAIARGRVSDLSAPVVGSRRVAAPQVATVLLTTTGDGSNGASAVRDVAVDGRGVVYAAAVDTDSVFRIAPDGTVTRILSATGDGTNALDGPEAVAVTAAGVVFVAGGASDNVFRVAADGTITRILSAAGVDTNTLDFPADVALGANGAVLVAGRDSDNVFRIAADGTVTQILSAAGDGTNALDGPSAVAAAPDGGVYVAGQASNNVFRIAANGTITQVASATGDGTNALSAPTALAVDAAGNALVVGGASGTVFRVTPAGRVTLVFKATADGSPRLQTPRGVAVDGDGQIYVSGHGSDNVVAIAPGGRVWEVLSATGAGRQRLDGPVGVAADAAGNVYVAGMLNHTAFRVSTRIHKVLAATDAGGFAVRAPAALALAGDGRLYVADRQGSGRLFTVTRGGVLEGSHPLSAAAPSTVSAPRPSSLALDAAQQFYVTGQSSDNVVAGALWNTEALRELVASAGDGSHSLGGPTALVAGAAGTAYVAGGTSDNVFRVTTTAEGVTTVSQLVGSGGDGTHALDGPSALALHSDGTLYVAGRDSDNVFRVTGAGVVSQVLARAGAGGHALDGPVALALNAAGDLFVASAENDNVFRVPAKGTATRVASSVGDGTNALDRPVSLAVDAEGELYVAGGYSHNVLRVSPGGAVVQVIGASGDGSTRFHSPVAVVAQGRGAISVATAGKTGPSPIPASVFRLEPRPLPAPPPASASASP